MAYLGSYTPNGSGTAIPDNSITNAKLADMAANTIKGNNTGGTADPIDLTAAQTTAMLDNLVGDSGSGGTKGLAPAPASGDAAAGKFLKADGTWAIPVGATNLGYTASPTNGIVTCDSGTNATLPLATATNAGLLAPSEKTNIGNLGSLAFLNTVSTAKIDNDAVTNAKLANMPANTFKANNTGSPVDPIDVTTTQATAMLNSLVGDSGSGGTKGLAPAPASGDAAAGKFLKADGTWAKTPSGDWPFVTIGATGADYTTFQAAIAANAPAIMVIGNTTETLDTVLPASLYVEFAGDFTINMGTKLLKFGFNNTFINWNGPGTIQTAVAGGSSLFDDNGKTGLFIQLNDVNLINVATAANAHIISSTAITLVYRNSTITLPNFNKCGLSNLIAGSRLENITIVGGGTSCSDAIFNSLAQIHEITFKGSFSTTVNLLSMNTASKQISDIYCDTTGTAKLSLNGHINGIINGGQNIDVEILADDSKLSNADLKSGTLNDVATLNCIFDNFQCGAINVAGNSNMFSNFTCTDINLAGINNRFSIGKSTAQSSTMIGSFHSFVGCTFDSSFSISGDDIVFSGSSWTTGTLTIDSAADRTRLEGCTTVTPVVNNSNTTLESYKGRVISPAQITSNQNDYDPTDFETIPRGFMRLTADANREITGFSAQVAGFRFTVINTSAFNIKFKKNDIGSAAANRISLKADLTLSESHCAEFFYDITSAVWRVLSVQNN